jgi:hypothetical protein
MRREGTSDLINQRAAEKTDAADEAGASDGASPLICVLSGRSSQE